MPVQSDMEAGGPPQGYGPPQGGMQYGGPPQGGMQYGGPPQGGTQYGGPPQGGMQYGGPPQGGTQYGGPPQGGTQYGGSPQGGTQYGGPPQGGTQYGGPPQGGMQYGAPPQQGPQTTVIIQTAPVFGPAPVQMQCPHCSAQVVTSVDYTIGGYTWMVVCLLFWLVGVIFSCIPCCCESCKDARHSCPNCKQVLGLYHRMDECC